MSFLGSLFSGLIGRAASVVVPFARDVWSNHISPALNRIGGGAIEWMKEKAGAAADWIRDKAGGFVSSAVSAFTGMKPETSTQIFKPMVDKFAGDAVDQGKNFLKRRGVEIYDDEYRQKVRSSNMRDQITPRNPVLPEPVGGWTRENPKEFEEPDQTGGMIES